MASGTPGGEGPPAGPGGGGPGAGGPPGGWEAPAGAGTVAPEKTATFACTSCGARLGYAPGTQTLSCPYCGATQQVPQLDTQIEEHDYESWLHSADKPTGLLGPKTLHCSRCGASVNSDDLSLPCPFCSAPIVATVDPREQVLPEGIVPFTLTKPQATESMRRWVGSRWFAPNGLKRVTSAERINGTYVPHWTYDANTWTEYSGQRGDYYYTTQTYTDDEGNTRTEQVQHIAWSFAAGQVSRWFDDVLVIGNHRIAPDQVTKLEPWSLENAVPFQDAYLAGYQTLRYEVPPESGLETARAIMARVIEGDCERDIGGDVQRVSHMNTSYADITFKLMLLPVYVAAYVYAGKTFQVYINAHTGHVVGERPYSVPKIIAAILAALLLIGALLFAYNASKQGGSTPTRRTTTFGMSTPAPPADDPLRVPVSGRVP